MVRAGRLDDSTLIARHLVDMPQVICASPDYLNKHGTPEQPEDLLSHYCVNFFSTSGGRNYPFELMVNSKKQDYFLKSWIAVNDAENYVLSALQGAGLIQVPRYHVANELKNGRLVQVLSEWEIPKMSVSALYPQHRQLSPRVRVFVAWLSELYTSYFANFEYPQK